jgi:hypothetical protein
MPVSHQIGQLNGSNVRGEALHVDQLLSQTECSGDHRLGRYQLKKGEFRASFTRTMDLSPWQEWPRRK